MTTNHSASFSAGQDTGTRISACMVRMAALDMVEASRWWNRWRRRRVARALVTCADELDEEADAREAEATRAPPVAVTITGVATLRSAR